MKFLLATLFSMFITAAYGQQPDWYHTYEMGDGINSFFGSTAVCTSDPGYWLAFVDDHHITVNHRHGDVSLLHLSPDGETLQNLRIEGNACVVDMAAHAGHLYLWVSAYDSIRLDDTWHHFGPRTVHLFGRMDDTGHMMYTRAYGDSISAWTVNARGEHVFTTGSGFGGTVNLYEVDSTGVVLRSKLLEALGYVFSLEAKTNADGYVIGGGCMDPVHIDSVQLDPPDVYSNYILSLDGDLTARWMRAIADISCVVNHVWSNGEDTYYAGETSIQPVFDSLPYAGPGTMGYDFFLTRMAQDSFLWAREVPGDTGWVAAHPARRHAMDLDPEGNVYMIGSQRGHPITWAPGITTGNFHQHEDITVWSYDPDGRVRWVESFGGAGVDFGMGLAVSGVDDVLIVSAFSDTMEVDGHVIPASTGTLWVAHLGERTTRVEDPHASTSLQVYPNPAADRMQVVLPPGARHISLYAPSGQLVNAHTLGTNPADTFPLDVHPLAPGLYIVHVLADEGVFTRKVFVQRP